MSRLVRCDRCGAEVVDGPVGNFVIVSWNKSYESREQAPIDLCITCWDRVYEALTRLDN